MARPKGSKNKTKANPAKSPAKGKAAAPAATEPGKGEIDGMITRSALNGILKLDRTTKTAQSDLAEGLTQKVGDACRRFGVNRKALGIIRSLNRMEPEKLADFLDHFDYMLDISGLEDRAAAVQRLPMDGAAPEVEGAEETTGEAPSDLADDPKVSRPQFGAKVTEVA